MSIYSKINRYIFLPLCYIIIAGLVFLFSTLRLSAIDAFEISKYDINMEVRSDNSYFITEVIDVKFNSLRHGIYRDIPLKTYYGEWASVSNIKVIGHDYTFSRKSGVLSIKIGDEDEYANTNERYIITYVFHIGDDENKKMDELYFNLIGLDWDVYIKNVSFKIIMPYAFDSSKLNFTYGAAASKNSSSVEFTVSEENIGGKKLPVISGQLKDVLNPKEALTVALPLTEGYYKDAKIKFKLERMLTNYYWLILSLILLISFLIYNYFGKNKKIIAITGFEPPKGLTPADIGFIYDGHVDASDVTSLLIYWADKGFITINETSKNEFIINKIKDIDQDAKPYEKIMFNNIFNIYGDDLSVSSYQLKNKFYVTMGQVQQNIKSSFKGGSKTRIFTLSGFIAKFTLQILTIMVLFIAAYPIYQRIENMPADVTSIRSIIAALILAVPLFMFSGVLQKWVAVIPARKLAALIGSIILNAGLFFTAFLIADSKSLAPYYTLSYIVAMIIAILSAFSMKRTALGDELMQDIAGFREFLVYAEKDRINTILDENPNYFYNVLPYAIVLGVSEKWAHKFDHITLQPPDWYTSYRYNSFSTLLFINSINSSMQGFSQTMVSKPASSTSSGGSFGGGSSGGGSGGGGGGSW